jgi:ParB family transcriptional regulator, chromosome partitioning protein
MRSRSDKTKNFLANLTAKAAHLGDGAEDPPVEDLGPSDPVVVAPKSKGLGQRMAVLDDAFSGRKSIIHYNPDNVRIDPDRCRPWLFHDRDIDGLNEGNCADLIEGFKEAGRQTTPGLVRPLRNDPEGLQYEVLVGVRRWWVCKHLGWQFEAEIGNPDDGEAFLVSDVENRSRTDLSDWERAWKYRRALKEIYSAEGVAAGRATESLTQEALAARLGQSPAWLVRLLDLTDLPPEVVAAFPARREILVNHGRRLKVYLDEPAARARVIAKATEIAAGNKKSAKAVVATLELAGKVTPKGDGKRLGTYTGSKGVSAVNVLRKGRRDLRIDLTTSSVRDLDEALALVAHAVQEHF